MDGKKVTIYDIAREANCSSATVSLVLKDDPRVKKETRDRVLEVIKKFKYKPSFMARGLIIQRTDTIGLIVPELKNPVFSDIIEGVLNYVNSLQWHLIVGVTNHDKEKEIFYLNMLREKKVDGLVILPTYLQDIRKDLIRFKNENFPFVLSGVQLDGVDTNYVSCNMEKGAYLATEHLIENGHKSIAFISGVANPLQSCERLNGYKKALEDSGIPFDENYVVQCGATLEDAYKVTTELIKKHPEITGIFCLYDYIAISVIKAILDKGARIPDDYAVASYDNIDISAYLPISLTTVETYSKKVGETAAKILVSQIKDEGNDYQRVVLSPKLIERQSTDKYFGR